jgi:glycerophosphoryl diester phosphodiesterase
MPRPQLIAHRGTPREHPENSLPGFRRALSQGVDGIELDVHRTRDGVPVVHHDPDLARDGSPLGGRLISELTAAELATHELAPGVTVPTLAEVVDAVGDDAVLYVEVKARAAEAAVLEVLAGREERAPVHSFDHRVARAIRAASARTPVGVLSTSYLLDPVHAMRGAGARDLWQHWSMIDGSLVETVHAAGGRVIAWTVNDPDYAVALARLGVDGICTDLPVLVGRALAPRSQPLAHGPPAASPVSL